MEIRGQFMAICVKKTLHSGGNASATSVFLRKSALSACDKENTRPQPPSKAQHLAISVSSVISVCEKNSFVLIRVLRGRYSTSRRQREGVATRLSA